jgi:thymidine kinase
MTAKLTVACGPMFSGKTEELIRRVRRALYADLGVQVFAPSADTRRGGRLVSHAGNDLAEALASISPRVVQPDERFARYVNPRTDLVVIDEAQFFAPSIEDEVLALLFRQVSVFVAGLDRDYLGRPFGPMPALLAHADEVLKLAAVCARCKRLDAATMSHRTRGGEEQIQIGGEGDYEPLCRSCWIAATT